MVFLPLGLASGALPQSKYMHFLFASDFSLQACKAEGVLKYCSPGLSISYVVNLAGVEELKANARSRSAKLRIVEKL